MSNERLLEIIEGQDKYYILGFIQGLKSNIEILRQENESLKSQQKEFIKYLEEPIKIITDGNPTNISEYTMGKLDTLKEILSKYKEIIGGENE